MTRSLATLVAGTALMGLATAANATTITQSFTPGSMSTDFQISQAFNLFDSTLGTLNSIVFTATYGENSQIVVKSNADNTRGRVSSESEVLVSSDSGTYNPIFLSQLGTNAGAGAGPYNSSSYTIDVIGSQTTYGPLSNGQSSGTIESDAASVSRSSTDTTASDLNAFSVSGGGTFNVYLSTETFTDNTYTGGNSSATQTTQGTPTFTLAYNYTAPVTPSVPEPASMALLGAGLLGAGLVRRKK